jgi:hypothetical protein
MSQTNLGGRRRVTVARARAAATRILQSTAVLLKNNPAQADAPLLAACLAYASIRRRADQLSQTKGDIGEGALEKTHAELHEAATSALADVAATWAVTLEGHRARAAAILFWDEGELVTLVDKYAILQDRLMLALLADLVGLR